MKCGLLAPKKYLLFLFSFLCIVYANAQTQFTGTVLSSDDKRPINGITVTIKRSSVRTTTNDQGQFTLKAIQGDTLVFTGVSVISKEILLKDNNILMVFLENASHSLNEVVVTALGIKKEKKLVSYSTQEVKGSDIVKAREPNPLNSLVGKVAGLDVGASPELLGRPQLLMRGNAITLFVVDGIPINSDTWNISPDDIENFTILKGPVASALYGYRGQTGAIVITTKRGSKNKRKFSVDVNSTMMVDKGFIALPRTQDEYGPGDHGTYAFANGRGAGKNDADYDIWGPKFEGQLIPQYDGEYTPNQTYTTIFPNGVTFTGNIKPTPWVARGKDNLKRFIQAGTLNTNNIAVSSSGENYDLRASLSNTNQRGIVPNTKLNSINFNISAEYRFNDRLKIDANLNYNRQFTPNTPDVVYGPNSIIYNITTWGGADWDIDELRNYWQPGKEGVQSIYAEYQRYHNPWFMSYEWLRGHYKTDIYAYAMFTYKLNKNFELVGRSAITTYDLFRNEKMPFSAHPYGREEGLGDYREDRRSLFENNTEAMLKYQGKKGIFDIAGFVGGNLRSFTYNSSFVTTDYLNVPDVYNFRNSRNPIKAYNFSSDMRVLSGYYSLDLSIGKWLNLNNTGRVDKLSTLPADANTYFYPSVSANTILTDYISFSRVLSFLKIRASYANVKSGGGTTMSTIGATPNQPYPIGYGGEYYATYDGPSYQFSNVYDVALNYNNQPSARYTNRIIDSTLQPDSRSNFEAGLEARFFKNRIGFDLTYYRYLDGPQIYRVPLSQSTGYTEYVTNGGKTRRTGLELTVNGTVIQPAKPGALGWNVIVNWSTYRDVWAELPGGREVLNDFFRKGDRTDKWYGSGFVYTPDGQIINDNGGRPIVNPRPQFMGYMNPDWIWGFVNQFSYQNFMLSIQVDGRVGGSMENYVRKQTFRGGRNIETVQGKMGEARYQDYLGNRTWVANGVVISNGSAINYDPVTGAVLNHTSLQYAPNTNATFLQDYISRYYNTAEGNLMSKTYLKLREITLGYNVPAKALKNTFIQNASISLVARNLGYWLKAGKEYKDVDVDQYAAGTTSSGLQTPTTRRYGININLTF